MDLVKVGKIKYPRYTYTVSLHEYNKNRDDEVQIFVEYSVNHPGKIIKRLFLCEIIIIDFLLFSNENTAGIILQNRLLIRVSIF